MEAANAAGSRVPDSRSTGARGGRRRGAEPGAPGRGARAGPRLCPAFIRRPRGPAVGPVPLAAAQPRRLGHPGARADEVPLRPRGRAIPEGDLPLRGEPRTSPKSSTAGRSPASNVADPSKARVFTRTSDGRAGDPRRRGRGGDGAHQEEPARILPPKVLRQVHGTGHAPGPVAPQRAAPEREGRLLAAVGARRTTGRAEIAPAGSTPREDDAYSVETDRGGAAAATRIIPSGRRSPGRDDAGAFRERASRIEKTLRRERSSTC